MTQKKKGIGLEAVESGDLEAGWELFRRNDWWEARNTFTNAYDAGGRDTMTLVGLGFALTKTGETEQGLTLLFEGHEQESTPDTRMALAMALADIGRFEDAFDILKSHETDDELYVSAEIRAATLIRLGRLRDAIPFFETLTGKIPDYAAGQLSYGLVLIASGDLERGLERSKRALECHKQHGETIIRPLDLDDFQYETARKLACELANDLAGKPFEKQMADSLLFVSELLLRLDFLTEAAGLLELALAAHPTAEMHFLYAQLNKSVWASEAAEHHARASVQLSGDDKELNARARILLAESMHQKHDARMERMKALSLQVNSKRFGATHVLSAHYPGISVLYTNDLDGGGRRLVDDYLEFIRERYGHAEDLFEWCTGPGFLGYAMLAHGFTDRLCLADINPKAVHFAEKTREANCLKDRVEIYLSDNLESIPESQQWDLVISNPPHFGGTEDFFLEIDRRGMDPNWRIHRKFFAQVGAHLKPGGELCIMEWEDKNVPESSTPELFRPMLEENGFVMVDAVPCKNVADHYYLIARKK
ncbi:MAG: methyltransferase [Rhodospirillales bacterium]|nr:methyltransferase [Alphaproteobacteria bacterium]MBL6948131.1 methyltransferase [Rhodospirillales bacterium]